MHMRVTTGRIDPSRAEEMRRIAEQTVAAGRQLPGCRSFQIAMDRSTGRLVAISTWDSPEQSEAMTQHRRPAEEAGVQLDPPELYEVIA